MPVPVTGRKRDTRSFINKNTVFLCILDYFPAKWIILAGLSLVRTRIALSSLIFSYFKERGNRNSEMKEAILHSMHRDCKNWR